MAVSMIVGVVRALAEDSRGPGDLLCQLNDRILGRLSGGFATCVAVKLDRTGNCIFASAGHPSPVLNGRELEIESALPLGIVAREEYIEKPFRLRENDYLALYTDGLLEARNKTGELYGFERLKILFASRPSASDATRAATDFGQEDDITVLTISRLQAGEQSSSEIMALPFEPASV
jgi:serine phosphatase RsbU (regulator of sigma subunit)